MRESVQKLVSALVLTVAFAGWNQAATVDKPAPARTPPVASDASRHQSGPDAQIEHNIQQKFAKSKINAEHFTVSVKGGVATLSGVYDVTVRRGDEVVAEFRGSSREITGNIGRSATNRRKMAVVAEGKGRAAITRYRVERSFGSRAAFVECRLSTGRTHQIRVHLAYRGHPLIGDRVYGTRAGRAVARGGTVGVQIAAFPRQALHARLLGFTHPVGLRRLSFASPLPTDLRELVSNLEQL